VPKHQTEKKEEIKICSTASTKTNFRIRWYCRRGEVNTNFQNIINRLSMPQCISLFITAAIVV
jgi:hypothetical protein